MTAGPPTTVAAATKVVDELADLLRPVSRLLRTRSAELVVGIALLVTALAVFAVAGAALGDRAITANRAVAQAEVLDGSTFFRTLVRFTTANGETAVPADGVAYPRGLEVGQSVPVEYELSEPDHVRVAGRSAFDQAGTLGLVVLGTWLVLGPLAVWFRRRRA